MRKVLVSALGIVTLAIGSTSVASSADLRAPVRKAPPPVAVYNWTGFYVGAHVGGAWGDKDFTLTDDNLAFVDFPGFPNFRSHDVSGLIAGGQIGFNWQAPGSNWVLGIEAQASWSNADGEHTFETGAGGAFGFRTEVEWLGTVTGRLGYAFDRVLVYAKGGFAFAHDKYEWFSVGEFEGVFSDHTRTGWTVGGGIEFALAGNWSVKGEYNYMDLGKKDVTFTLDGGGFATFDVDQQIHVAKFGVNYRFGGPLVARY